MRVIPSSEHGEGDDLKDGWLVRFLAAAAVVEVHLLVAVLVQQHLESQNDYFYIFMLIIMILFSSLEMLNEIHMRTL